MINFLKQISFALIAILTSCSPNIRVYTDHDPGYDLENYKTFDWSEKENIEHGKNPLRYNELNDKRIKTAVREELESRGYLFSEIEPDLVIHYHIVIDDQSIIANDPFGHSYSPNWIRMQTNIYSYREGTLIIDLMDARTNNLIWRGWAVSAINEVLRPEEVEKLIRHAVSKIFRKFPSTSNNAIEINNRIAN
jgi:hypothetical protein